MKHDPAAAAWLAFAADGSESSAVYLSQEQAQAADEWGWTILPLYRQPQPILTDEEREAIEWFSSYGASNHGLWGKHAASLRGLLERTERRS